jgi:hypothetical protein
MSLPAPLTPAGCDLTSHTYFPLHYDRLLRSRWWRRASDLARSRNMDLWAHAFREVPSASLPDDDADLADMAGFGRDLAAFLAVKTELLEPWVRCSDGRWYHPTLAEVATELWGRMDGQRRANRERQNAHRARLKQERVTLETGDVTRDVTPKAHDVTRDRATGRAPVTLETGDVTRFSGPKERKGYLGSNDPVASASPRDHLSAVPESISPTIAKHEPWARDAQFSALWDAATPEMRRRAKSKAKVWPEWVKARRLTDPGAILGGLAHYLERDPDVKRTGGPGLHIWLRDRTFEAWSQPNAPAGANWPATRWAAAVEIWMESGRWDPGLGPDPGQPGCRAPPSVLIQPTKIEGVA